MQSNYALQRVENPYVQSAVNQTMPTTMPMYTTSPIVQASPMPVYRNQNQCDCCIVVMIIFGILFVLGGITLIILGKVVFVGYETCSYYSYSNYCSYVSAGSSIFIGVGAAALSIGCILIIIAVVLKLKKSSRNPNQMVRAYPVGTI